MKAPRRWTNEETSRLKKIVLRQQNQNGDGNIEWTTVAEYVRTRNNKECRKRWFYVCDPSISKGRWRQDEDDRLREAVEEFGTRWGEVAKVVDTRNPDQCSKRYHEVLKPNITRDRWSFFEDDMLQKAVLAHGRSWIEITERYFPGRTPLSVRNRYFHTDKVQRERQSSCISCGQGLAHESHSSASPSELSVEGSPGPSMLLNEVDMHEGVVEGTLGMGNVPLSMLPSELAPVVGIPVSSGLAPAAMDSKGYMACGNGSWSGIGTSYGPVL